jgi:hypothetical protein
MIRLKIADCRLKIEDCPGRFVPSIRHSLFVIPTT